MVTTKTIRLSTKGNDDMINLTDKVTSMVKSSKIKDGIATIFIPGSTGAITTIEYESGVLQDLKNILEKIVPSNKTYKHNLKWHDGNGHSHLKASLIGPSLSIPINKNKLELGTWQQIIFIDCDNRSRNRELVLQIVGE